MEVAVTAVGLVVGVLYGVFGAGASAFATPVLALVGVPGIAAVASPLPGTLPAAVAAAWSYVRRSELHWPTVRRALAGALPATLVGARCAPYLGGDILLALSAVILAVMGARLLRPVGAAHRALQGDVRGGVVVAAASVVGFLTGLLANGGGFLLVPLFLLVVGLSMRQAAGTSLVTAAVLAVPTVGAHWLLGDIDWRVAGFFALGLIPGSAVGGRVAARVPAGAGQRSFGAILVAFAVVFMIRQLG